MESENVDKMETKRSKRNGMRGNGKDKFTHKCDKCDKSYKHYQSLKLHISSVHKKERRFACESCSMRFTQASCLRSHIACVHEQKREFKCDKCHKTFNLKIFLNTHIKIAHGIGPQHKCHFCDRKYEKLASLKEHIAVKHSDVRSFKCDICNFKAATESILKSHISRHDLNFKCHICEHKFAVFSELKKHSDRPHFSEKMSCDYKKCKFSTWFKDVYESHAKSHAKVSTIVLNCPECDFEITKTNENINIISKAKRRMREHRIKFHKIKGRFRCKYKACDLYFVTKADLKEHFRSKHSDLRPRSCCICGQNVQSKDFMHSRHVLDHIRKRDPFKCRICGFEGPSLLILTKHYCKTHGVTYNCQVCDYITTCKTTLQEHETTWGHCKEGDKIWHDVYQSAMLNIDEHLQNIKAEIEEECEEIKSVSCVLCDFSGDEDSFVQHLLCVHYCKVNTSSAKNNTTCLLCNCPLYDSRSFRLHFQGKVHLERVLAVESGEPGIPIFPTQQKILYMFKKICCTLCNWTGTGLDNSMSHFQFVHNCRLLVGDNEKNESFDINVKCLTCSQYYHWNDIANHFKSSGHQNRSCSLCTLCNWSGRDPDSLITHFLFAHNCELRGKYEREPNGSFVFQSIKCLICNQYSNWNDIANHIKSSNHRFRVENANSFKKRFNGKSHMQGIKSGVSEIPEEVNSTSTTNLVTSTNNAKAPTDVPDLSASPIASSCTVVSPPSLGPPKKSNEIRVMSNHIIFSKAKASDSSHTNCTLERTLTWNSAPKMEQIENICELCDFKGSDLDDLNHHLRTVHDLTIDLNNRPLKLHYGNEMIPHKGYVFRCLRAGCGALLFTSWLGVKRHLASKKRVSKAVLTFQCNDCKLTFISRYHLKNHLLSMHQKNLSKPTEQLGKLHDVSKVSSATNPCEMIPVTAIEVNHCGFCAYYSVSETELIQHLNVSHNCVYDPELSKFTCKVCSFATSSLHHLKIHICTEHNHLLPVNCMDADQSDWSTKIKEEIVADVQEFECNEVDAGNDALVALDRSIDIKEEIVAVEFKENVNKEADSLNEFIKVKEEIFEDDFKQENSDNGGDTVNDYSVALNRPIEIKEETLTADIKQENDYVANAGDSVYDLIALSKEVKEEIFADEYQGNFDHSYYLKG